MPWHTGDALAASHAGARDAYVSAGAGSGRDVVAVVPTFPRIVFVNALVEVDVAVLVVAALFVAIAACVALITASETEVAVGALRAVVHLEVTGDVHDAPLFPVVALVAFNPAVTALAARLAVGVGAGDAASATVDGARAAGELASAVDTDRIASGPIGAWLAAATAGVHIVVWQARICTEVVSRIAVNSAVET